MNLDGLRQLFRFDNCCQLLAEKLFFRRTNLQVYRIAGLEVIADNRASDAGSIRYCIATDVYSRYLGSMTLPQTVNVLDLGANAGGFPLMLHVRGIHIGKLVCVELNPNTYERLRFNILTNFPQAVVLNAAVVKTPREIKVTLGRGSTADSIYSGPSRLSPSSDGGASPRPAKRGHNEYSIGGRSFDDIASAYFGGEVIDLCKMDIEGAEDEVVAAADSENRLLAQVRYLLVEFHNREKYDLFAQTLLRFGLTKIASERDDKTGIHLFHNPKVERAASPLNDLATASTGPIA